MAYAAVARVFHLAFGLVAVTASALLAASLGLLLRTRRR